MPKVTLKGWTSRDQHRSESCLPDHLYSNSNFKSVSLIKLVQSTGCSLAQSKKAIDELMDGHDFTVEFSNQDLAKTFEVAAKKYGADIEAQI